MKAEEYLRLEPRQRSNVWARLSDEEKARVGEIEKGLPAVPNRRPRRGIVLATTPQIEGSEITEYLQIVGVEIVIGANILKDSLAQIRDIVGGRSGVYEKVYSDARKSAIEGLREQASQLSADAVVGVRFDFQALGHENGMAMVAATGTAVKLYDPPEVQERREKAYEQQRQRAIQAFVADEPIWQIELAGKLKGPFSVSQIRELIQQKRVERSARVVGSDGAETTAGELVD